MNEWIFCLFHWYTHYLIDSSEANATVLTLGKQQRGAEEFLEPA